MNPRNSSSQPQHYAHPTDCGCMKGDHIWDTEYEKEVKNEKWCVCCEHFFFADDVEDEAADNAVETPNKTPSSKPQPGGLKKGVIRRR